MQVCLFWWCKRQCSDDVSDRAWCVSPSVRPLVHYGPKSWSNDDKYNCNCKRLQFPHGGQSLTSAHFVTSTKNNATQHCRPNFCWYIGWVDKYRNQDQNDYSARKTRACSTLNKDSFTLRINWTRHYSGQMLWANADKNNYICKSLPCTCGSGHWPSSFAQLFNCPFRRVIL